MRSRPRLEKRNGDFNNETELGDQLARSRARQGFLRDVRFSSLYHVVDAATGKSVLRQQDKAYMFSSPTVVGDVVLIGVLNGTLDARDVKSGELLWEYQTETSKENKGWVLTADRKFNAPMLFNSNWREAPMVATDRQFNIGAIFSTPLVVNGVVYFGSTDGNLYAVE